MSRPPHILHEALDGNRDGIPDDALSVKDLRFGAKGDGVTDDTDAINRALTSLTTGRTLYFPPGTYLVSGTIEIAFRQIRVVMDGYLSPYQTFSDYLLTLKKPASGAGLVSDFQGNIGPSLIRVDCQWASRGVKLEQLDVSHFEIIEVLRPYGVGLKVEGVRECTLTPLIVSGLDREVFSEPDDYDSGTAYTSGQRVKFAAASWDSGTTYTANQYAEGSDGVTYRSLAGGNLNNNPITDNINWVWEPTLYFEAIESTTNESPLTYNTYNSTPEDRKWKRVYRYEASVDLNQEEITNDGTNSNTFINLRIRNCDNRTLLRIDASAAMDSAVTGNQFIGGHIHGVSSGYADGGDDVGGATLTNFNQCIEIGKGRSNVFLGTLVKIEDSIRGVGIRIGSRIEGALSDRNKFIGMRVAADSSGAIGLIAGEELYQIENTSINDVFITLPGGGARDYVGLSQLEKWFNGTNQYMNVPSGSLWLRFADTDNYNFSTGSFRPGTSITGQRDLGTSSAEWRDIHINRAVFLGSYNVAGIPSPASNYTGSMLYCTNGDAGSPCLAVSNGTNWLRIALGTAVSAT